MQASNVDEAVQLALLPQNPDVLNMANDMVTNGKDYLEIRNAVLVQLRTIYCHALVLSPPDKATLQQLLLQHQQTSAVTATAAAAAVAASPKQQRLSFSSGILNVNDIVNNDELTSLGYYFDDKLYLRDLITKKRPPIEQLRTSEQLVSAVAHFIQSFLVKKLFFNQILVPTLEEALIPKASCPIYCSTGYHEKKKLLVIVQGAGKGLQSGVWSRILCLMKGLNVGSMLPQVQRALNEDYGVIIMNPNQNYIYDQETGMKHKIKYSERPEIHGLYVWRNFVVPSMASNICIMAHGYGSEVVTHVLRTLCSEDQNRKETENLEEKK